MLERVYLEIGNICNLSCSFCTGTNRAKKQMTVEQFSIVCKRIKGKAKYVYFHVLGEPLLHPNLDEFIKIAGENDLKVCITTNGTLLKDKGEILLKNSSLVHKVCISVHSFEGNKNSQFIDYLKMVVDFARESSKLGIYTVFRLWNNDGEFAKGEHSLNQKIEDFLRGEFPIDWQSRPKGYRLDKNLFLEYDEAFVWPTDSKENSREKGHCYGLINQVAILVDGTVTPCCLDSNGEINLGNIFSSELDEILCDKRAILIKKGFINGELKEKLCKKCTFIKRFNKKIK